MKTSIARREFLFQAGRGFGLFALHSALMDGLVARILNQAFAQTTGASSPADPTFYVHISLPGGPPRWYFDLPLAPTGVTASNYIQGGFGTVLTKTGTTPGVRYETRAVTAAGKTLHLPPVWTMNLTQHDFSKTILPHTLMIRGVDMEIDNHTLSNRRQVAPVIGGHSLSGVVADKTGLPLPTLLDPTAQASRAFRTKKGLSGIDIVYTENASTNPVTSILNPFLEFRNGRETHNPSASRLGEQVLVEFEKYAAAQGITQSALSSMYDAALELVDKNVTQLSQNWASTVAKYRGLVIEAVRPRKGTLPGLFDTSIPGNQASHPLLRRDLSLFVSMDDLRDLIGASTNIPRMAENFALSEILLGDLTSTVTLGMPPLTGLQHGSGLFNTTHDEHRIGAAVSAISTTLFYRALLGCTSAFVAHLKSKKMFENTVIQISSEFNRTPRIDGSGSDHGFMGSAVTLISGKFNKPAVIGNIKKASYNNTYQGTFGVAANFPLQTETRPLRINDVARSVSALLGIDDVTTNGESLVVPSGNFWVPRKEEAKNV